MQCLDGGPCDGDIKTALGFLGDEKAPKRRRGTGTSLDEVTVNKQVRRPSAVEQLGSPFVLRGKRLQEGRERRMVELNVIEQVHNLGKTNIVQNAWNSGNNLQLHGWVYDLKTGVIHSQTSSIGNEEELKETCKFEQGIIGR